MKFLRGCAALFLSAMALAQTFPLPMQLGRRIPEFQLAAVPDGSIRNLESYSNYRFLVFLFLSTHCQMSTARNPVFNNLNNELGSQGALLLGVYSGRKETLAGIHRYVLNEKLTFPCFRDTNNRFADQLGAHVTPEVFVFDQSRRLRYHGSVDPLDDPKGSRDRNLRQALEALLNNLTVSKPETKPFGCVIDRQTSDRLKTAH